MEVSSQLLIPFIPRPNEYERLVAFLVDQRFFLPVALTTSLPGGCGFGKSTLAHAICHDPRILSAFTDGIAWVSLGSGMTQLELYSRIERLIFDLSGEHVVLDSLEMAEEKLHELLHPRQILLVIDDADDEQTLRPFLQAGPGGACLLIAHDDSNLPITARRVPVDIMMSEEAAALLVNGLPETTIVVGVPADDAASALHEANEFGQTRTSGESISSENIPLDEFDLGETGMEAQPGIAETGDDAGAQEFATLMGISGHGLPGEGINPSGVSHFENLKRMSFVLGVDFAARVRIRVPVETEGQVMALADRLNDWPLLLGLVNGLLRGCVASGDQGCSTLPGALRVARNLIDQQNLRAGWRIDDPLARSQALTAVLAACVAPLSSYARNRYLELTVFALDVDIPLSAVQTLWGISEPDTRSLCKQLASRALIGMDVEREVIRLNPTVHASLSDQLWAGQLQSLHNRLVDGYRARCQQGWASGPDDGYYFQYLAYHLNAAGHQEELQALLFDYDWLAHYLLGQGDSAGRPGDLYALLGDYDRALSTALDHQSAELRLVQDALGMSAPVLIREPAQLAPQLLGRLLPFNEPEIREMIRKAQDWQGKPWLRPLAGCFTPPGGDEVRAISGHEDWVTCVALLPDDQRALSGSLDGTLRMWDLANGNLLQVAPAHKGGVSAVRITPDGQTAVSSGWDGIVRVWNLLNMQQQRAFRAHLEPVGALVLNADGHQVITGSDDRLIRVWDLETGKMEMELMGHSDLVRALAVTPDGRTLVSGSWDSTLRLWDLGNGKLMHILTGHEGWVRSVTFSPDGSFAISGAWDRTVRVWDLWTGETVRMASGFLAPVFSLAVTSDSRFLITGGGDGNISLRDFETMEERFTLSGHTGGVNDMEVTRSGRFMVSSSDDRTLRVWDLMAMFSKSIQRPSHAGPVCAVTALPDGQHALTGSWDGTLKVWEPATGKEIRTLRGHQGGVLSMAVTADGRLAVSGSRDCTVRIWDLKEGKSVRSLSGHEHPVTAVAITPDGRVAVSGDEGGVICAWNLEDGECLADFRGESSISVCALSADGHNITASESGGRIYFLEIKR